MTIASQSRTAGPFTGTGLLVSYPFAFKIFTTADLLIQQTDTSGSVTTWALGGNFTVVLNADQNTAPGGTITPLAPLPTNYTLMVTSNVPVTQSASLTNAGGFFPKTIEDALDRLTILIQQAFGGITGALRVPEIGGTTALPPVAQRANLLLSFDSSGNPIAVAPSSGSAAALATQLINTLLATQGPGQVGFNPTLNYVMGTLGGHLVGDAFNPRDFPWLAKFDGATDDTAAINACATAARSGPRAMKFPGGLTALVSGSINVTGLHVIGQGPDTTAVHIQCSAAQFDLFTSTGDTVLEGIKADGGNAAATSGLTGDIVHFDNGSGGFVYNCHINRCRFQFAKRDLIWWQNAGYGSIWQTRCNTAGRHGLSIFGNSSAVGATTVMVGGMTVLSGTPNGYGAVLTECVNISFSGVIIENTQGIQVNGNDNRALSFDTVYQENTAGGLFITFGTSAGIGLSFANCFGGGTAVPYPTNWQEVYYRGNANLTESAVPLANRVLTADGGQQTTSTTGGVSVTAASLSIPPGTWMVYGVVQSLQSSAVTFGRLGATVTTNAADGGLNNSTSSPTFGSDEMGYVPTSGNCDVRVQPFDIIQNTTSGNITVYLRSFIVISAGSLSYRGLIKAVKLS